MVSRLVGEPRVAEPATRAEASANASQDMAWVRESLAGSPEAFESLVVKYQPKIFASARRYSRHESEIEDIVQEVFIKAHQKLASFRGESPFEHWLMRLAVRTCYDFLRKHQRSKESRFSDLSEEEAAFLENQGADRTRDREEGEAAKALVDKVLSRLGPAARLVITLLEIEDRTVREIAELTGWSVPVVKVRAFRARAEMRRVLATIQREKYL